jgi:hypothetical protein
VPSTLTNPVCARSLTTVIRAVTAVGDAELLVVANGAGPRQRLPILDQPPVRVLESTRPGPGAARNVGLRAARHPIVLFTDDDCVVPPTWCADMAGGLRRADTAAAAAPVDVLPVGPVTAFLNHQRTFHATALDATRVQFPLTAACAVDRTRTDVCFDERFLAAAGEDVDFGFQIRDRGGEIAWLDVPPVAQALTDTVDQLSQRFLAYGQAAAMLYLSGRASHQMPYAHIFYRDLCDGCPEVRRQLRQFRELPDPAVRAAFVDLPLVVEAATLAGYLAEVGDQLGETLVEIDRDALRDGWRRLFDRPAVGGSTIDWTDLRADLALMPGAGGESGAAAGRQREVGELLRAHANLRAVSNEARAILLGSPDPERTRANEAARAIAASVPGTGWTLDELDRSLRAAGVPFGYGMLQLELVLSPLARSAPGQS